MNDRKKLYENGCLQYTYESGCLQYAWDFETKHSIEFDGWVNNEVGEIATFNEMFVEFRDLKFDIDSNLPEHIFAEWYYDCLDKEVAKPLRQYWIELQIASQRKLSKKDKDKYLSLANAIQKYAISILMQDFEAKADFITPTLAWLSKELRFINLAIERNTKPSEFLEQYNSDNSYFYELHNGKKYEAIEEARKKSEAYILELIKTTLI